VDGPLLYYPSLRLWEAGWDTVAITYGYQSAGRTFSIEVIPDLMDECSNAVLTLLSERAYPKVCLVGKSLGAGVVALLCQSLSYLDESLAVYLTPPVSTPLFAPVFKETRQRSLLLIGTADRYYDPQHIEELQTERPFDLVTIPDTDHSMNLPGDLPGSLNAVELVTEAILAWLGE
jgi:dienelactone hydrolase